MVVCPTGSRPGHLSSGDARQYVFKVAKDSTKTLIKQAVEQIFNVKVRSVCTSNVKAESVRFRQSKGSRKAWKKAYVTLEQGQELDVAAVKS